MTLCHGLHKGIIQPTASLPCGITNTTHPHTSCCKKGDYCLSDLFCQGFNGNESVYYTADCTDETLTDPACIIRCGSRDGFMTYTDKGIWACCEGVDCSASDEIYPAPPPSRLSTIRMPLGTTYSVATVTARIPIQTGGYGYGYGVGSSEPLDTSDSKGIPLGISLIIGIGVTAAVMLILAVLALTGLWYYRRRSTNTGKTISFNDDIHSSTLTLVDRTDRDQHELNSRC